MNIYVANLTRLVNSQDLTKHFSDYGEVSSAKVINDKFTGESRGFAFLEMPDDNAGRKAISELNGSVIDGRNIVVNEAKPQRERERSDYGRRW
ncbi:RNA-binding protein [Chitinophaga horti]|uniref:RNA-binding protein n=1 Tax=Chitinophaga horti TaxID=2920382 RepID=A0ABY6J9U8_9BACT|nr:RNA-binding protein [Chitinophaga horti]UYQ94944.1 RNA-binding protein [Chitinophaga horti]